MEITPKMIEAAARARCKRDGGDPDHLVHYEAGGTIEMLREPIQELVVGTRRSDGSVIRQWPTMPLWQWKYAAGAEADLRAAFAVAESQ